MISITYVRYIPTLDVSDQKGVVKNIFKSEIYKQELKELTEAMNDSKKYLENHFGAVLLYHNEVLIKRMCNYKLFQETFKKMNLEIELQNHIN